MAVVERIHQTHPDICFVLTGTPKENFIARYFEDLPYVKNLIGKTSVLELAALMSHFKLMISNDTGPLHVACAMDIPVISFFKHREGLLHGPMSKSGNNVMFTMDKIAKVPVDKVVDAFYKLYANH